MLSSSLSFLIDSFTFAVGLLRSAMTLGAPLKAIGFNVVLACLARGAPRADFKGFSLENGQIQRVFYGF